MDKELWIACDHGGYELKCKLIDYLKEHQYSYCDAGCHSTEIVRYPYYAAQVAQAVSTGKAKRGILLCSTGIGMSILANKYPGVRAALCTSVTEARLTREHNDSNILCMGGRITGDFHALEIAEMWLTSGYIGGRHDISLSLIQEAEQSLCSGQMWTPKDTGL